jgi:hypothetical protein
LTSNTPLLVQVVKFTDAVPFMDLPLSCTVNFVNPIDCLQDFTKIMMKEAVDAMSDANAMKQYIQNSFNDLLKRKGDDSNVQDDMKPATMVDLVPGAKVLDPLVNAAKEARKMMGDLPSNLFDGFEDAAKFMGEATTVFGALGKNVMGEQGKMMKMAMSSMPLFNKLFSVDYVGVTQSLGARLQQVLDSSDNEESSEGSPPTTSVQDLIPKEVLAVVGDLAAMLGGTTSTSETEFIEETSTSSSDEEVAEECEHTDGSKANSNRCLCRSNQGDEDFFEKICGKEEDFYCNTRTSGLCFKKATQSDVLKFIGESFKNNPNAAAFCPDPALVLKYSFGDNLMVGGKSPLSLTAEFDLSIVIPLKKLQHKLNTNSELPYITFSYGHDTGIWLKERRNSFTGIALCKMTGLSMFCPEMKDYKRVEVVPAEGTYVQKPRAFKKNRPKTVDQTGMYKPCPTNTDGTLSQESVENGCILLKRFTTGTIIDHYKQDGLNYRVVELDKCPDGMVEEKATVANDCDKHGEEKPKQKPLLTALKSQHPALKKQQKKKGAADLLQEAKCGVREIILPCVINVPEVSFEHFKYVENDKPLKKEDYGTYILPMNFDTGIKKGLDGISLTNALLDIVSRGKFSVGVQCEHEKASIDGGFSTSETTRFGRRNWFQEKFFGLRFVYDRIFKSRTKGTAMQKAWTTMSSGMQLLEVLPLYGYVRCGVFIVVCSLWCVFNVMCSLYSHCILIVFSLYSHCILIVFSLYSHCALIVLYSFLSFHHFVFSGML